MPTTRSALILACTLACAGHDEEMNVGNLSTREAQLAFVSIGGYLKQHVKGRQMSHDFNQRLSRRKPRRKFR